MTLDDFSNSHQLYYAAQEKYASSASLDDSTNALTSVVASAVACKANRKQASAPAEPSASRQLGAGRALRPGSNRVGQPPLPRRAAPSLSPRRAMTTTTTTAPATAAAAAPPPPVLPDSATALPVSPTTATATEAAAGAGLRLARGGAAYDAALRCGETPTRALLSSPQVRCGRRGNRRHGAGSGLGLGLGGGAKHGGYSSGATSTISGGAIVADDAVVAHLTAVQLNQHALQGLEESAGDDGSSPMKRSKQGSASSKSSSTKSHRYGEQPLCYWAR